MGADIHFVVEKKIKDSWVGVYSTDYTPPMRAREDTGAKSPLYGRRPTMKERDYRFFGALAGVRYDGPDPLGPPDDMSELAALCLASWDGDAHSTSHCSLLLFAAKKLGEEAVAALTAANLQGGGTLLPEDVLDLAGLYQSESDHEYRVVFWFDN